MKKSSSITRLGVVFVILSVACGLIDDIQQKKAGIRQFCASVALPLGTLVILWVSRPVVNNPNQGFARRGGALVQSDTAI